MLTTFVLPSQWNGKCFLMKGTAYSMITIVMQTFKVVVHTKMPS